MALNNITLIIIDFILFQTLLHLLDFSCLCFILHHLNLLQEWDTGITFGTHNLSRDGCAKERHHYEPIKLHSKIKTHTPFTPHCRRLLVMEGTFSCNYKNAKARKDANPETLRISINFSISYGVWMVWKGFPKCKWCRKTCFLYLPFVE